MSARACGSILWVDDHPEGNALLRRLLADHGVGIELAVSTEQAMGIVEAKRYALIVSDMERRDQEGNHDSTAGLGLLRALRQRGIAIPCVIFTSVASVARHESQAYELGATGITSGAVTLLLTIAARAHARAQRGPS